MPPQDSARATAIVGILGAGRVSELYHLPVLHRMPGVRLSWLCDRVEKRARSLARMYGIRRVYTRVEDCPDVDILLVAVPVGCRREAMQHAFARGWHVFCEKPFATTCAEHDWTVGEAARSGVEVGVGLMRRFYAGTMRAEEIVAQRLLGPLLEVWASEGARIRRTDRDQEWYQADQEAAGGGILIETGSHLIDQVLVICGARACSVDFCRLEYRRALDYEARLCGEIKTAGGDTRSVRVALSRLNDLYDGIVLRFPHAELQLGLAPDSPLYVRTREGRVPARLDHPEHSRGAPLGGVYRAFAAEWRAFLGQCATRTPSRVSADTARLTTQVIEACYRQATEESGLRNGARTAER